MDHFRTAFLEELTKLGERKKPSKKRRAAGLGTGAVSGAALGAPAGLFAAALYSAMRPKKYSFGRRGAVANLRYFLGKGFQKDLEAMRRESGRRAVKGVAAGVGGGALVGGLAGHELAKAAAALRSQLTPQSSNVRGYSYDPVSQDLVITYRSGGTYRYKGVPPGVARSMGRSKSVGKAVHRRVKGGGFEYEKVAKSYTCKVCGKPATKGQLWAEGRAIATHCDSEKCKTVTLKKIGEKPLEERDLTKQANGDMIAYYRDHPEKAKAALERRVALLKQKRAAGKYLTKADQRVLKKHGSPINAQELARFGPGSSPNKKRSAQERFVASRSGNPKSPTAKYYAKKRREARLAKTAEEQVMMPVEPLEPPLEETPVSKKVLENLTLQAKSIPEESQATQADLVMDKLSRQRRQIAKLAGAAKKTFTWGGLCMKFEYLKGDERSGVNGATGKKWSRIMRDHYGYIPGTYGKAADGEAIDVYFAPEPMDGPVYKIRQKKKTGEYDEDKFMVGYGSELAAEKAFLRNMPNWALGPVTSMSMRAFRNMVGQGEREVCVPSDGKAERERVRKALG